MCPSNISRFLTCIQCLICHTCFFYFPTMLLVGYFSHTYMLHIHPKNALYILSCKTFTMHYFLYVDIPSYLYFAYLAFNVHASNFSYNYTFITFEIPINVSSRFNANSSSTTHAAQYST